MDLYFWDGFVYFHWIEPLGVDSDLKIWFKFPSFVFCELVFLLDFVLGNAYINPYAHCKQGSTPRVRCKSVKMLLLLAFDPTLPFLPETFFSSLERKGKEKVIVRLFPDGWPDFLGSNKTNVKGNKGHNSKDFFFFLTHEKS